MPKPRVSLCGVGQPLSIARIERKSLLPVGNALIPVSLSSCDQGESSRDIAAARHKLLDVAERRFGELIIPQHPILIISLRKKGFGRVRLEFLSGV